RIGRGGLPAGEARRRERDAAAGGFLEATIEVVEFLFELPVEPLEAGAERSEIVAGARVGGAGDGGQQGQCGQPVAHAGHRWLHPGEYVAKVSLAQAECGITRVPVVGAAMAVIAATAASTNRSATAAVAAPARCGRHCAPAA